ncbi:MAG: peptidase [Rhodobacteraceae bacterium]|nr:peptidase [Paracoccaceae bacterium]MCB1366507.1 peptidase [Paracoccaceae bacterium]
MSRPDVVALARGWIGTPYLHQASLKGAGADCLGLLRGVWREAYGHEPEAVPAYTPDWSEPSGDEVLWRAAARHMAVVERTAPIAAGQVLLFRMHVGAVAKHLGIAAGSGEAVSFIHAYTGHGVIESVLSEPWRRRIVARFRFH